MVASGQAQPERKITLKGGEAKYDDSQLKEIQDVLKSIPAQYYRVEIVQSGNKVNLGSANLRDLETAEVYSSDFKSCKPIQQIVSTISNYVKVVFTSGRLPADLKDRVAKVDQLLKAGLTR